MDFKEALVQEANRRRERVQLLIEQRRRLDTDIAEAIKDIESINPALAREGVPVIVVPDGKPAFATPGNRSDAMPNRRAEFADKTLAAAIGQLLGRADGRMHANELAEAIFEIANPQQLAKAKQSLVSTLATGAKKGQWRRVGPNLYLSALAGPEPVRASA